LHDFIYRALLSHLFPAIHRWRQRRSQNLSWKILRQDFGGLNWLSVRDGVAALGAEMSALARWGAALATEASADRDGEQMDARERRGHAGPDEGYDPANAGPTEEEIQEEDRGGVALVASNDGGKEIQEKQEE
jgi:hypothetical protein